MGNPLYTIDEVAYYFQTDNNKEIFFTISV